jgi:lysophospholipase L1-like esterase
MYRFQISAETQPGEVIGLVGSTPELGSWDANHCIRLQTNGDRYPLWWADVEFQVQADSPSTIHYKYVRLKPNGKVEWEAWGSNRWVPLEVNPPAAIVVEEGWLGTVPPCPYGYYQHPVDQEPLPKGKDGLKVVVLGSSVAMGCSTWLLQGWAWQLGQALHEAYGHQLVNRSQLGANVSATIDRFPQIVVPENPDVVIIALSLGNEGLAYCPPYQRRAVQRRFESGLQQLIKMTREIGAIPILGGLYPNGDYNPEHGWLLRDTHERMLSWDVPVLNWLDAVEDGQGRWQKGLSFDVAHPNGVGHRRMAEAIALDLFNIPKADVAQAHQHSQHRDEIPVFRDNWGFHLFASRDKKQLRIINTTKNPYTIAPYWDELQAAVQGAGAMPGIYVAQNVPEGTLPFLAVREDGRVDTTVDIPPSADVTYQSTFDLFSPHNSQILFYDGHLGILKEDDQHLRLINETDEEYNVHPMWKEVRSALKAMPIGVYEDPLHPDAPFRTLMIGSDGLESRVKVPPRSAMLLQFTSPLSAIRRVAILPLGDRCAARMLLYKLQLDGPAFPFDLTRTTLLSDVADMVANDFHDMWNPALLSYSPSDRRLYHRKWTGLSFGHEVEDTEDPLQNMAPIYERMRVRYSARAERFLYTIRHADELLFIRTGGTTRGYMLDLLHKLELKCQGKPFRVLLISPQPSEEFADLANVIHYDLEFNPDRMYADLDNWMYCANQMGDILTSLGVSSKNLFWCPPNPPKLTTV